MIINSWKIAWRNLTRKKLRTLFAFLAIMFGVAAILAVTSTVETTKQTVFDTISTFNAKAHMQIKGTDSIFDYSFKKELESSENVTLSVAHLAQPARLELSSLAVLPYVIDPNTKALLHGYSRFDSELLSWKTEEGSLQMPGLVVTKKTAEKWKVSIGQAVSFQVGGMRRDIVVSAIVSANDDLPSPSSWDSTRISRWHAAVPLDTLQAWTGRIGLVQDVQIRAADGAGTKAMTELEALLKPYPAVYLDPIMMNENDLLYGLDDIYTGLYLLGGLGLLMGALILFSSLYVSVVERRREFAVMKTIGCTSGQVASIVLREVLLLAVLGTAAGIVLGIGLAYGMNRLFMQLLDDVKLEGQAFSLLSWQAILIASAAGLVGSLLAALVPLYRASKVNVSYVLRQSVEGKPGSHGVGWILIGSVLIGCGFWLSSPWRFLPLLAGLLLLFPYLMRIIQQLLNPFVRFVFGFEGVIASAGISRQFRRMSMVASILCMGLSFLLVMGFLRDALTHSVEQSVRAMTGGDLVVNTAIPITEQDLQEVNASEGVAGASVIKETTAIWRGEGAVRKVNIVGAKEQSDQFIPMFTSEKSSVKDIVEHLKQPHTIALGHTVYKAWGGKVGENITLDTPKGTQTLQVVAVVNAIRENGNIVFVAEEHMQNEFEIVDSLSVALLLEHGMSQEAVKRQMVLLFGERLSGVRMADEYLESRREQLLLPFTMMNILIALIVLLSGVGILNTLLMNVFERTREFGTMRAIASTPWQVRKIVLCEGLIIGVCAIVTAIGLGLSLSYAISADQVIAGFSLAFFMPWSWMIIAAGLGLSISLISAYLPAAVASRIPLNEALHYE
ncbi:FtsX-like permease family protein [Candidatus Pristimantibacillus sp. PTI5]|uniref:ABC transporter permease n=1 Tax=Candidatus Pristimantibacillus sp. PTI5 TaxID=3400422 RepID=UPI003B01397A